MTFVEAQDEYWKYYISLEEQFVETRRYVEFDYVYNGRVYSMEYLKLFQAVCSEIDVVGKILASNVDTSFKPSRNTGINEWWYFLVNVDPSIESKGCCLFDGHSIYPWKNFKITQNANIKAKKYILDETVSPKGKTPTWWTDYNSVKHNRTGQYQRNATNYAKANLKNLFYAFAALFILEAKLMESTRCDKETVDVSLESKLFTDSLSFYTMFLSLSH